MLLLVVQALAVTSGALPVYWLARKHLGSNARGAHFAVAYLLYPATQFNTFTITGGFHAVASRCRLILYAIWFLDKDRLVPFAVFALLAATTKEEIPPAVGCLGIWYAVRTGGAAFGFTVFALGLGAHPVQLPRGDPALLAERRRPVRRALQAVGSTPGGIFHKLFTDPRAFVHAVATGHKLLYVVLLLVPFLGLWALEPLLFLGAVPDLAINLLSSKSDQTTIPYHWTAGIIPFVVAASVFGAARFRGEGRRSVALSRSSAPP